MFLFSIITAANYIGFVLPVLFFIFKIFIIIIIVEILVTSSFFENSVVLQISLAALRIFELIYIIVILEGRINLSYYFMGC